MEDASLSGRKMSLSLKSCHGKFHEGIRSLIVPCSLDPSLTSMRSIKILPTNQVNKLSATTQLIWLHSTNCGERSRRVSEKTFNVC